MSELGEVGRDASQSQGISAFKSVWKRVWGSWRKAREARRREAVEGEGRRVRIWRDSSPGRTVKGSSCDDEVGRDVGMLNTPEFGSKFGSVEMADCRISEKRDGR